ncbi:hypothetical protein B0T17DRAFT_586943 [Bombardia bombarda]|uniref:BZIP domain-containing protein n=1 Tax=Bombardia bombarda TaxID=252184 RepID=A0AA39XJZ7_9PEZI|nr:hypothetical protein B0T17DRAFT_586943 [Bombardia bombarda]
MPCLTLSALGFLGVEPEHDAGGGGGGGGGLQSFHSYSGKLDLDSSPISADGKAIEPRSGVWEGFAEHAGTMMADHKPLFVDPRMYDGDNDDDEIKAQIQVLSEDLSRPSTRRASSSKSVSQRTSKSASTSIDITPPDQDNPDKKRKTRKTRKESDVAKDKHKRSKFLERNRVAASKCREKKKQYVSDLEETKIGLEAQHAHLQMEYNGLLGEVSGLKHHLMTHAKCNDPNINRWLDNEARRFVQTNQELLGQPFTPNFGQPSAGGQVALSTGDSPRSRNDSIASTYQALQGVQLDGLGSGERKVGHSFPPHTSPTLKREPGINYDHMPDNMFSPRQSTFGGG